MPSDFNYYDPLNYYVHADINLPTESGSTIHSGTVLVVVLVSTLAILQQQTSLVSYSDIL